MLAAAHELGIPVTPRGGGTGNYGQAMPLNGGVLLNLAEMNKVNRSRLGRVVCEPGAILIDVDKALAASGQELRMFPSTRATASIAGFVAGGSGGVGSIAWGGLRDFGNVLRLRVLTMEDIAARAGTHRRRPAQGRARLRHQRRHHRSRDAAAARYDWVDVIVGFDSFEAAAAYGAALGEQDGILKKLVTAVAAPAPQAYFLRHRALIPDGQSVVDHDDRAAFARRLLRVHATVRRRRDPARFQPRLGRDAERPAAQLRAGLEPHDACARCASIPRSPILQVRYPATTAARRCVKRIHDKYGGELIGHLEFIRFNGRIEFAGLAAGALHHRGAAAARSSHDHEAMGAMIFNPHRYTLEEGGMKQTDAIQLAFKRETDPQGLLNPGKMIAFEDPNFDFAAGKNFLFPGLEARAAARRGPDAHSGALRASRRNQLRRGGPSRPWSRRCASAATRSTIAISTPKVSIPS